MNTLEFTKRIFIQNDTLSTAPFRDLEEEDEEAIMNRTMKSLKGGENETSREIK